MFEIAMGVFLTLLLFAFLIKENEDRKRQNASPPRMASWYLDHDEDEWDD